ncbi:MAG: metallopeptidase family protein [Actinobacteria bacterium]|nr:metallopeptidase family protein [Actinomycetota bacterium]
MFSRLPTGAQVAWSALAAFTLAILAITAVEGLATTYPLRLLQGIAVALAGALVITFVLALVTGRLADWRNPRSEHDFDALVERSEQLAREGLSGEGDDEYDDDFDEDDDPGIDPWNEEDFKALVRSALDELPLEFHRALEHVAVVVGSEGRKHNAYGLYHGATVAHDGFARIVIFQDTMVRDFGHDLDLLRSHVVRTVRHELAHHLGWDEDGVRGLGL